MMETETVTAMVMVMVEMRTGAAAIPIREAAKILETVLIAKKQILEAMQTIL